MYCVYVLNLPPAFMSSRAAFNDPEKAAACSAVCVCVSVCLSACLSVCVHARIRTCTLLGSPLPLALAFVLVVVLPAAVVLNF